MSTNYSSSVYPDRTFYCIELSKDQGYIFSHMSFLMREFPAKEWKMVIQSIIDNDKSVIMTSVFERKTGE